MSYIGKSPSQGVRQRYYFTATGSETSLSGADDSGAILVFTDGAYVDVYLNGVLLVAGTDYNTTTTNTIGGLAALAASDIVEIIVYDVFTLPDAVKASTGGTFNANVTVNGTLAATAVTGDGSGLTGLSSDLVDDTTPQLGGDLQSNGNDVVFADSDKAIFGAGSDLQIYHDGSNSRIVDAGTGNLNLQADNNINILNNAGTEFKAQFITNGAVNLFYDNGKKFETTATGVDVTGGLNISGNASNASALSDTVTDFALKFDSATTASYFSNAICFAEGTNVNASIASFDGGSGGAQGLVFGTGTSNTEAMRIDSSGTVTATAINASQSSQTSVGATCMGWLNNTTTNPGTSRAGSAISFSNTIGDYRPSTFGVGTWRCHGAVQSGSLNQEVSVWQRIS